MLWDIAKIRDRKVGRFSSWDTRGQNHDCWQIKVGETRVLADIKGPGVITHIWMTQNKHYRQCLLRITFDNAPHPSVLCPLGDFFGLGHGIVNSYQSALFTASTSQNNQFEKGCALNCYAPMPFAKRAVVELINESPEEHGQYFYVDYETLPPEEAPGKPSGGAISTPSSAAPTPSGAGARRLRSTLRKRMCPTRSAGRGRTIT